MRALALLLNIVTIAAALAVTVWLVPGVNYTGPNKLLVDESFDPAIALGIIAAAFMVVNSTVGPIVRTVGAPINCLTLGLFSFVVNIAILWLASVITNAINTWYHFHHRRCLVRRLWRRHLRFRAQHRCDDHQPGTRPRLEWRSHRRQLDLVLAAAFSGQNYVDVAVEKSITPAIYSYFRSAGIVPGLSR